MVSGANGTSRHELVRLPFRRWYERQHLDPALQERCVQTLLASQVRDALLPVACRLRGGGQVFRRVGEDQGMIDLIGAPILA